MNTTTEQDTARWYPGCTGYPGDQQADLHDSYWAEVGPDNRYASRGLHWSWTILDNDSTEVDGGLTVTEPEAKAAVADWAEADLLSDRLAAEIAEGVLSEMFSAYGHNAATMARAMLAVAATDQIAC